MLYSYIFIVSDDSRIILALLEMVRPIDGRTKKEVKVNDDKLEAAQRTCSLLSISLLSITFFRVVASWLRLYAANVLGASSTNCFLFSSDVRHFVERHLVYSTILSKKAFCRSVILSNVHFVEICFVKYFRLNILCSPRGSARP